MAEDFEGFGRPAPVPKMVQDFVVYCYRHIRQRNVREIYTMYSLTFPHLSERFFKGTSWPPVSAISHLVDHDHVFCMLYREMTFRHLYAKARPTVAQRAESWANYASLFQVVLSSQLNVQLPNAWLWDMIDEFIYQYQSWAQFRGKVQGKTADELEALQEAANAWEPQAVLAILNQLVANSKIREELSKQENVERMFQTEAYIPGQSNVLHMLGYFSLVGLLRMHSILGDARAGLQALAPLSPFNRRDLFATKIAMANVTMFYYCSFAYLQMGRYVDAARCLNFVLGYIVRVKAHHARGPGYDQLLKKNEQLYAALALALALCPPAARVLEESVHSSLREKCGEKLRAVTAGSVEAAEELFAYACPKFVSPTGPDWSSPASNANMEAYRQQLAAFLSVLEERRHLPALKQFLSLYSSITVAKLARLAEMDEASLRSQLELLRRSTQVVSWDGGDALAGKQESTGELDFSIENQGGQDMVVVRETGAVVRDAAAFIVQHISKFEDIARDLDAIVLPQAGAAASAAAN